MNPNQKIDEAAIDEKRWKSPRNFSYQEMCGCMVQFDGEGVFRRSRIVAEPSCTKHGMVGDVTERNELLERANEKLKEQEGKK